jgi:LacI family gluconate utilization system Gnt-I transcriptional repressor
MMAKVTMQEISKLAGVSPATVSRALHSPHLVRKDTRERIARAMETSDYVYNATAGDLSRKRSSMIGVIIPTTKSLVFSPRRTIFPSWPAVANTIWRRSPP